MVNDELPCSVHRFLTASSGTDVSKDCRSILIGILIIHTFFMFLILVGVVCEAGGSREFMIFRKSLFDYIAEKKQSV